MISSATEGFDVALLKVLDVVVRMGRATSGVDPRLTGVAVLAPSAVAAADRL